MTTILIVGLPSSYTHFLETLQVTKKLDKLTFDELSEMLSQHNKTFGKKKQVGEDIFFIEANTSKSSIDSSRSRGRGHFVQGRGQSQSREKKKSDRSNFQGRGNSQIRGYFEGIGNGQGRGYFQGRGNSQGRGYFQGNCQGRGYTPNRGQNRGRGQNSGRGRDLSQIVCRRCNKVGHYAEDCRTSIDKISKFHQNTTQFANDRDDDGSEYVFTSSSALHISTNFQSDYEYAWILELGASQHMTFRRDFFWIFQECHLNYVFLADNTKHNPYGKGVVKVYLPYIGERMISNVWYVPTFKKNLLSLVTIRQAGHQVIMEDDLVKINSFKQNNDRL
jgi:hypothetical protein